MTAKQLTREQLAGMTPAEIDQAREDGRLDQLLGRPVGHVPESGQLTREHLRHMTPEQVIEAQQAGRLDDLMTTQPARYATSSGPYTPPRRW